MIIFVALLLVLSLYQCKPLLNRGFYADYASRDQSRAINGICIVLILFSHTFAKVAPNGVFDQLYAPMRVFLGQFVVVPFLFYSGYGMMESLTKKEGYLKTFPKKRFLKIAVQFAIITVVYMLMHLCLQSKYSIPHMLLSFVGITSIGNGGWYMLSIFFFYAAILVWFSICKHRKVLAVFLVTGSIVALMAVEVLLKLPSYYYNTVIFFAVGMFYSLLKKPFDRLVMKNNVIWGAVFLVSLLGFCFLKRATAVSVLFYPVWCGFGMLAILCLTMKVRIQNKALIWLGTTVFFNFTLQGIPQIIFSKYLTNNYVIYLLVIVTTLLLTAGGYFVLERKFMGNKREINGIQMNKTEK